MKQHFLKLVLPAFVCLAIFSCERDPLAPTASDDMPSLAADFGDTGAIHCHCADTVCDLRSGPLRSTDGSYNVNIVPVPGSPGCYMPGVTSLAWGNYSMLSGGINTQTGRELWLDFEFTLAPGWVADEFWYKFGTPGSYTFANSGEPNVDQTWAPNSLNPWRNSWRLSMQATSLPECFEFAARMSAVRLYLGTQPGGAGCIATIPGAPNENTRRTLWLINPDWNVPGSATASASEYLFGYCPEPCWSEVPEENACAWVPVGIPQLQGCTNLDATYSNTATYQWSTGATTATAGICTTVPATYTVTISEANTPVLIRHYNVQTANIGCGNGKVSVCSAPPGNPGNANTLCLPFASAQNQVTSGQATWGACGFNPCAQ